MLVLVVLIVAMVAAWTFALWPRPRAGRDTAAPQAAPHNAVPNPAPHDAPSDPAPHNAAPQNATPNAAPHNAAPKPVEPPPRAESTEGLLVAQLVRGELTRLQYRRAMACLAERDESRHPMTLPGE